MLREKYGFSNDYLSCQFFVKIIVEKFFDVCVRSRKKGIILARELSLISFRFFFLLFFFLLRLEMRRNSAFKFTNFTQNYGR